MALQLFQNNNSESRIEYIETQENLQTLGPVPEELQDFTRKSRALHDYLTENEFICKPISFSNMDEKSNLRKYIAYAWFHFGQRDILYALHSQKEIQYGDNLNDSELKMVNKAIEKICNKTCGGTIKVEIIFLTYHIFHNNEDSVFPIIKVYGETGPLFITRQDMYSSMEQFLGDNHFPHCLVCVPEKKSGNERISLNFYAVNIHKRVGPCVLDRLMAFMPLRSTSSPLKFGFLIGAGVTFALRRFVLTANMECITDEHMKKLLFGMDRFFECLARGHRCNSHIINSLLRHSSFIVSVKDLFRGQHWDKIYDKLKAMSEVDFRHWCTGLTKEILRVVSEYDAVDSCWKTILYLVVCVCIPVIRNVMSNQGNQPQNEIAGLVGDDEAKKISSFLAGDFSIKSFSEAMDRAGACGRLTEGGAYGYK